MTAKETSEAVLIPTGRMMKSYGCIRSLSKHGIETIVASEEEWIPHFSSRYTSERIRLPAYWDDIVAYKDALVDIASRPEVKTIVPVRECDVYVFAKYEREFDEHVSILSPSLGTLERTHDRLQLATEAEAAGVPHAETAKLSEADGWDRDAVIKTRFNILTDHYIDSRDAGTAEEISDVVFLRGEDAPDLDELETRMRHEPIIQAFIPEEKKHLYCALWEDGEPLVTYQHRQIRKVSWVGGGGVYRESVHNEEVDAVAKKLLSHLNWDGYACIEYLKDRETGEWKFLEINPRVWLSLPEAVRAGVDFPYYYWRRTQGDPLPSGTGYDSGIRCHISYGELKHLLSVRRDESPFETPPSFGKTLAEIIGSCIRHPRFDYIRYDDPGFVLGAIKALGGMDTGSLYRTK